MNNHFKDLAAKANFGHIQNDEIVFDKRLEKFAELVATAERQRIVNMFMIMHEAAKETHNYWLVASKLIEAECGVQHDN